MPIFTLHDSIVTAPPDYSQYAEDVMLASLESWMIMRK